MSPQPYLARLVLTGVLIAANLVLILTIGTHRPAPAEEPAAAAADDRPQPRVAVPNIAPSAPEDRPDASDQAELEAWAGRMASATGLPARVVAAYGLAEMWLRSEQPDCHLSWGTLAGIGRVESVHGSIGESRVGPDGLAAPPIVGPPLDGSAGVRAIPDTDGGTLDGDEVWDRAVGPMQLLPSTWREVAGRASGDGERADPQNVDDAALAAAHYLCATGADLATPAGWWDAVLTYNHSIDYAQDVFLAAARYGTAATS